MSDTIMHCNFGEFTQQFRRFYSAILAGLQSKPGRIADQNRQDYFSNPT